MKKLFTFPSTDKGTSDFTLFVVESNNELKLPDTEKLLWILNPDPTKSQSGNLQVSPGDDRVIRYVGPNLMFETPDSEQARAIAMVAGLPEILRIEKFQGRITSSGEMLPHDPMLEAVYDSIPETLIRIDSPKPTEIIPFLSDGLEVFSQVNKRLGLGMDAFDMDYYFHLFTQTYQRNPTEVELMQIAQGNSSHSRHWEFTGRMVIDGVEKPHTLLQMVKETLRQSPDGSIKAFHDNGGIFEGGDVLFLSPDRNGLYWVRKMRIHYTSTAETHNHPTLISPYPGAATGAGGRQRDIAAIKCGSLIGFAGVYFQTGRLWLNETPPWIYPKGMATPREVLAGAILGASGYGNPFGEPTLLFGNDALGIILPNGKRVETIKPIIYTCATGTIPANAKDKAVAKPGMAVVRIGGSTRRIGVGGGAASSMEAGSNNTELDFKSVQRGEPITQRKAYNVIEYCVLLGDKNPIEAIHDQGAGGASNMLTELVHPSGGTIQLRAMNIADVSLSQAEAWVAESQELFGILIKPQNLGFFIEICNRHECPYEILGKTDGSGRIVVEDESDGSRPVDLGLAEILGDLPQKTYADSSIALPFEPFTLPGTDTIQDMMKKVARLPGVALLNYMVDHFDGSVGGRVVQGPRNGAYQLPVCNYAVMSQSFHGYTGVVGSFMRSNPVGMLINEKATARMTLANLLTTLAFAYVPGGTRGMKSRLNEMCPFKLPGEKARLYNAVESITGAMCTVGLGADGGKDSLSMSVSFDGETVSSFPTLVLKADARMNDFRLRVTPALKKQNQSKLVLIELPVEKYRMGGCALAEAYGQTGNEVPDADPALIKVLFELVQGLVKDKKILAGAPRLKGGLLTTLAKMCIASSCGVELKSPKSGSLSEFWFNEEAGVVVQCKRQDARNIIRAAENAGLRAVPLGNVNANGQYFDSAPFVETIATVRSWFLETGAVIKQQLLGVSGESMKYSKIPELRYQLTFNPDVLPVRRRKKFRVAVLCAPGTNGHHELANMFMTGRGAFDVQLVHMSQLLNGEHDLEDFKVVLFPGGFSYGDVLGSGKGWAASILFNEKLKQMFDDFFARPDTLSFGVCNGFQVGCLLGIFDTEKVMPRLLHNVSQKFEHHPVMLSIPEGTRSIMLRGMQGSILPAWAAHGEGYLWTDGYEEEALAQGLVAVQYVGEDGCPTETYPANPNGSPFGLAGLCSADGRHTFMMPHIERVSASNEHIPAKPDSWDFKNPVWQKAIMNMHEWLSVNS